MGKSPGHPGRWRVLIHGAIPASLRGSLCGTVTAWQCCLARASSNGTFLRHPLSFHGGHLCPVFYQHGFIRIPVLVCHTRPEPLAGHQDAWTTSSSPRTSTWAGRTSCSTNWPRNTANGHLCRTATSFKYTSFKSKRTRKGGLRSPRSLWHVHDDAICLGPPCGLLAASERPAAAACGVAMAHVWKRRLEQVAE